MKIAAIMKVHNFHDSLNFNSDLGVAHWDEKIDVLFISLVQ